GEEQAARGEQQGSDRRRRRGRRGGRRRRGGGEEGLAGSINDELGTGQPSEAADAVADFDGFSREAAPSIAQVEHAQAEHGQAEHIAEQTAEPQIAQPEPHLEAQIEVAAKPEPEPAPAAATAEEPADDKATRRRSTVREKVSFLSNGRSEPTAPVAQAAEQVAPPAPAAEPAPQAASETPAAPRRAGWWSRRFGGGGE
ncbi:MAG: ribonuclease E/G, partial [Pseudomonadota bacterium]